MCEAHGLFFMSGYGTKKYAPKPPKEKPIKVAKTTRSNGEDVTKETHRLKNMGGYGARKKNG